MTGPDVFLSDDLTAEFLMDSISASTGVDSLLLAGATFLLETGLSGGRDRMKSRMMSLAWLVIFVLLPGTSPSTMTLFSLYLFERMSSMRIS
jgi:hypothetical protein